MFGVNENHWKLVVRTNSATVPVCHTHVAKIGTALLNLNLRRVDNHKNLPSEEEFFNSDRKPCLLLLLGVLGCFWMGQAHPVGPQPSR